MNNQYSEQEQKEVFDLCLNKKHWKYPINATISAEVVKRIGESKITSILIDQTGGAVFVQEMKNGKYKVTGAGYFNSVGA